MRKVCRVYKLSPVKLEWKEERKDEGVMAEYSESPTPRIIFYGSDTPPSFAVALLLHELGHHFIREKGVKLQTPRAAYEEYLAERFAITYMAKHMPSACRTYVLQSIQDIGLVKKTSLKHYLACASVYLEWLTGC
jgi:hypothetical protein